MLTYSMFTAYTVGGEIASTKVDVKEIRIKKGSIQLKVRSSINHLDSS